MSRLTVGKTYLKAATAVLAAGGLVLVAVSPAVAADTAEPNTTITAPQADQSLPAPILVAGGATDDVGVTRVQASLKDRSTALWWNGSGWVTTQVWFEATVSSPGATNVTWSWTVSPTGGSGSLLATARARDASAKVDTTRPTVKFTLATTPLPTYTSTLMAPGLADLTPVDVAATATSYFAIDVARYRIAEVDRATGTVVNAVGSGRGTNDGDLGAARSIALDDAGNVYVADTPNARISVYDENLVFQRAFGSTGSGPGQFTQLYGLAVGQGQGPGGVNTEVVYAIDGGGRIQTFTTAGALIRTFVPAGVLNQPRMAEVHPVTKDLWVVNARQRQVVVFTAAGTERFRFGGSGAAPGKFNGDPRGIAISPDGSRVYVSDEGNHRVQVFDGAGLYLTSLGGPTGEPSYLVDTRGLDTAPDGTLVVSDEWDFALKEWTTSNVFGRKLFGNPAPVGGVNSPRGLAVDDTGRVYVSDWWNQRIQRIGADGSGVLSWGYRGTRNDPGSINFAWDVALQPGTDRLFVANRESHEIEVFTTDGDYVTRWGDRGTTLGRLQFPHSLAFDPTDGTLLVTDSANNRVQRFTIGGDGRGTFVTSYGGPGTAAGQFAVPTGIDVAADGTIWVADTRHSKIQKRDPVTGAWSAYTKPNGNSASFNVPWGVTVAPDGNIWVADSGKDRIVALTPSMDQVFAADGTALGSGPLDAPYEIEFGPGGTVYVSDTFKNRVIVLQQGTP